MYNEFIMILDMIRIFSTNDIDSLREVMAGVKEFKDEEVGIVK